jgi:hypothetical protein
MKMLPICPYAHNIYDIIYNDILLLNDIILYYIINKTILPILYNILWGIILNN